MIAADGIGRRERAAQHNEQRQLARLGKRLPRGSLRRARIAVQQDRDVRVLFAEATQGLIAQGTGIRHEQRQRQALQVLVQKLAKQDLCKNVSGRWRLTPKGFMLSNSIIVLLLEQQQKSKQLTQKK